ncbi:hypothetical protein GEV33_005592 [Tenebrio molitor]|uniref:Annexin n=1 Tax=Tenebrio molitor TaxID=7067 RepID=A0A8J6HM66_TENMO|nr:hypothetical protein GEV33_005592 [Tenebrio molitor]
MKKLTRFPGLRQNLESDLKGDTSGHFRRLMVARDESMVTDQQKAAADAQTLYNAEEKIWGTDESVFNVILCQRNYAQLELVFQEYKRISGHDLEEGIKSEFSGNIQEGLLSVVHSIKNKHAFFAKRLHKSMKGLGTHDRDLIRLVVTRCEIDMGDIKKEYKANHKESLADAIKEPLDNTCRYIMDRTANPFTLKSCPNDPTVFPTKFFLSTEDAHRLKKATNGSGTDKETIIQVLTNRSNSQRLEIKSQFEKLFTDDLLEQLKKHLSGDFRNLIEALLTPLPQLYAQELNRAVKGLGTDEKVLIEILCTLSNSEIRAAKHAYHKLYHKQLVDDIKDDTSGNFKSLLELLVSCTRDEYATVDVEEAQSDAQALYEAGEKRWGTDASFFNQILVRRSRGQLALIFEEYEKLTGHSMEKAIKGEFCGDIEDGLLAIVESVKNKAAFFAKRLYKSMKGMGTDDRTLIRIVVTRCEIDMAEIKWEYEANYSKTLANAIKVDDTSGDYRKCLLALIGEARRVVPLMIKKNIWQLLQRLALEKEWRSLEEPEPKTESMLLNEPEPKVELRLSKEPNPTTEHALLNESKPKVELRLMKEPEPKTDKELKEKLLQRLALEKEWRSSEGAEPKAEQALLNESKPKVELMLTKEPEPTTEQECLGKPEFKQEQAEDIENFKKALEDRDHQNIINLLTKRSGMERLKFKEYVEYSYATDSINKSMRKSADSAESCDNDGS